jgi:hypothetical protein
MLKSFRLASTLSKVLFWFALVTVATACEQSTGIRVTLEDKVPPSFSVSGSRWVSDFQVEEIPQNVPRSEINPLTFKGETVWKISAPSRIRATAWPGITYGEVPQGFSQEIPEHGPPSRLTEGKVYIVRAIDTGGPQGVVFFKLRDGRLVNATHEMMIEDPPQDLHDRF